MEEKSTQTDIDNSNNIIVCTLDPMSLFTGAAARRGNRRQRITPRKTIDEHTDVDQELDPVQKSIDENTNDSTQDKDKDMNNKNKASPIVKRKQPANDQQQSIAKRTRLKNPQLQYYTEEEEMFYKRLPPSDKEFVTQVEIKVRELNKESVPTRFQIIMSGLDEKIKAIAIQKLNYMYSLDESSSEYVRTMQWMNAVCKIPFGKYKSLPVDYKSPKEDIKKFLMSIQDNMNSKVYGHKTAKDHIVRLLAQWVANPDAKGMVVGIHGSPGVGKTTLIKDGICAALGLPFAFIPLGGANDGCYLEGHSYTYEGATWGKTVDVLMKAGCMNPVIFFDELDKISDTNKGEEIVNYLVHMTDSTQNDRVNDKYFADFEFDLSRCLIIFSYNNEDNINPVLKDRMIRISTDGYTINDKVAIAQKHMIPDILKEYNFKSDEIQFDSDILKFVIEYIDEEKGVRNLRRSIHDIISNINLNRMLDLEKCDADKTIVDINDVRKYVHNKKKHTTLPFMYT